MRFWTYESHRKVFEHQNGQTITRQQVQKLEREERHAREALDCFTLYEESSVGLCEPMCSAHRVIMMSIDEPQPAGVVQQRVPPQPAPMPGYNSPFNGGYNSPGWSGQQTPAYMPPSSPRAPPQLVVAEAAKRLVLHDFEKDLENIQTKIRDIHTVFLASNDLDGGVSELESILEKKLLSIQTEFKECQAVEKGHKNEKLLDDITKMIPSGICAVSQQLMRDPVRADDGRTYDRSYITKWFANCLSDEYGNPPRPISSPCTREVMTERLVPNDDLRNVINELLQFKNAY
jgi:hypothetical protein